MERIWDRRVRAVERSDPQLQTEKYMQIKSGAFQLSTSYVFSIPPFKCLASAPGYGPPLLLPGVGQCLPHRWSSDDGLCRLCVPVLHHVDGVGAVVFSSRTCLGRNPNTLCYPRCACRFVDLFPPPPLSMSFGSLSSPAFISGKHSAELGSIVANLACSLVYSIAVAMTQWLG